MFLRKKDGFVSLVLRHLGTSALMDLLLRLVSCVEPAGLRQEVLHVSVAPLGTVSCAVGVWWVLAQEAGRRRGAQGPVPPLSIPWFSPLGSSGPCPCGSGPGTYRLALSASFSPTLGLCSVKSRNEHSSPPPASVPMALERLSQGLAVQSLTVRKAPADKGSMQRNGKDRGGLLCPGACTLSGLPGVHSQRTCP